MNHRLEYDFAFGSLFLQWTKFDCRRQRKSSPIKDRPNYRRLVLEKEMHMTTFIHWVQLKTSETFQMRWNLLPWHHHIAMQLHQYKWKRLFCCVRPAFAWSVDWSRSNYKQKSLAEFGMKYPEWWQAAANLLFLSTFPGAWISDAYCTSQSLQCNPTFDCCCFVDRGYELILLS